MSIKWDIEDLNQNPPHFPPTKYHVLLREPDTRTLAGLSTYNDRFQKLCRAHWDNGSIKDLGLTSVQMTIYQDRVAGIEARYHSVTRSR